MQLPLLCLLLVALPAVAQVPCWGCSVLAVASVVLLSAALMAAKLLLASSAAAASACTNSFQGRRRLPGGL
jgi:hypothetical protein